MTDKRPRNYADEALVAMREIVSKAPKEMWPTINSHIYAAMLRSKRVMGVDG